MCPHVRTNHSNTASNTVLKIPYHSLQGKRSKHLPRSISYITFISQPNGRAYQEAERLPICMRFAIHLVQANVHRGPLSIAIWWSHSPTLRQCRATPFLLLVRQPGT